jgi:hypothetical protein
MSDLNTGTTALHQLSPVRVEHGLPIAYRLISKLDVSGNTIYVLQGLFRWQQGRDHGRDWRDLPTQEFPYIDDSIPFS